MSAQENIENYDASKRAIKLESGFRMLEGEFRAEADTCRIWRRATDQRLAQIEANAKASQVEQAHILRAFEKDAEIRVEWRKGIDSSIDEIRKNTKDLIALSQGAKATRSLVQWITPFLVFVSLAFGIYAGFRAAFGG